MYVYRTESFHNLLVFNLIGKTLYLFRVFFFIYMILICIFAIVEKHKA